LPKVTLLINPISIPIQIAIYQDNIRIVTDELEGRASEVLLPYLEKILQNYDIERIIYVNGPGSYMAIKLTYIALKSIQMIRDIPFDGCSAFELNDARAVRAMGSLYFIKEKETIMTQKFDEKVKQEYNMPDNLSQVSLEDDNKPCYILPAV